MNAVRGEINSWVARYRRDTTFSGRPSYGNTYSAVNALAGHLNSFGPTAPLPKKRLERLVKVRERERVVRVGVVDWGVGLVWRGEEAGEKAWRVLYSVDPLPYDGGHAWGACARVPSFLPPTHTHLILLAVRVIVLLSALPPLLPYPFLPVCVCVCAAALLSCHRSSTMLRSSWAAADEMQQAKVGSELPSLAVELESAAPVAG